MKNLRKPFLMEGEPGQGGQAPPASQEPGLLGSAFAKAQQMNAPPPDPNAPPASPPPTDFTPNPLWDTLQVEKPADLSAANEAAYIEQVYMQRAQAAIQPPELPPQVAELNQQFQNPEFDYNAWLNEQVAGTQLMQKTGKEFMVEYMNREYKDVLTPEKIAETVEGMSDIDLTFREAEAKKSMQAQEAARKANEQAQLSQQQEQAILAETQRIDRETNELFARTKNVRELYGIEISEAEVDTFNRTFKELVTPDPQTGQLAISNLLQSNDDLWKFAYIALQGEPQIKEALFNAKEGTKASVFNQLKRTPSQGGNQTPTPVPNQLNTANWKKPSIG